MALGYQGAHQGLGDQCRHRDHPDGQVLSLHRRDKYRARAGHRGGGYLLLARPQGPRRSRRSVCCSAGKPSVITVDNKDVDARMLATLNLGGRHAEVG
jgi:hypothetical protein